MTSPGDTQVDTEDNSWGLRPGSDLGLGRGKGVRFSVVWLGRPLSPAAGPGPWSPWLGSPAGLAPGRPTSLSLCSVAESPGRGNSQGFGRALPPPLSPAP